MISKADTGSGIMIKVLDEEKYHLALCYYILAKRAYAELHKFEGKLMDTLDIDVSSANNPIADALYEISNVGEKEEFDKSLRKSGIVVELIKVKL